MFKPQNIITRPEIWNLFFQIQDQDDDTIQLIENEIINKLYNMKENKEITNIEFEISSQFYMTKIFEIKSLSKQTIIQFIS